MNNNVKNDQKQIGDEFSREFAKKVRRKLKAQSYSSKGVWLGLGMMGLVGWSVAIPTLLGAALGVWIDKTYSSNISWTLTLLVTGLCLGSLNSWFWLSKEDRDMQETDSNE